MDTYEERLLRAEESVGSEQLRDVVAAVHTPLEEQYEVIRGEFYQDHVPGLRENAVERAVKAYEYLIYPTSVISHTGGLRDKATVSESTVQYVAHSLADEVAGERFDAYAEAVERQKHVVEHVFLGAYWDLDDSEAAETVARSVNTVIVDHDGDMTGFAELMGLIREYDLSNETCAGIEELALGQQQVAEKESSLFETGAPDRFQILDAITMPWPQRSMDAYNLIFGQEEDDQAAKRGKKFFGLF